MAIRCDGTKQCPLGDDEEGCQIEPLVRFLLSENFIIIVIFPFIVVDHHHHHLLFINLQHIYFLAACFFGLLAVLCLFSIPILGSIFGDGRTKVTIFFCSFCRDEKLSEIKGGNYFGIKANSTKH